MKTITRTFSLSYAPVLLLASALVFSSGHAFAEDFYLKAQPFDKIINVGGSEVHIPMWGYALCTGPFDDIATTCDAEAQSPGPELRVPANASLRIFVDNQLLGSDANITKDTSILIPGLTKPLKPRTFTDSAGRSRIDSFDAVVAQGATSSTPENIYTWTTPAPGTYLYHSGTHPQVQVQMGLYGAVIVEAGTDLAYPGVPYTQDAVVLFSEIDPALHEAVALNNYANADCDPDVAFCPTSTEDYKPRYFLINGEAFPSPDLNPMIIADQGDNILLRLVNGGIENHAPQLLGAYFEVIAEDGHRAPTRRSQHTLLLPAGKTQDVLFQPTEETTYTLFDRRLRTVTDTSLDGGMMARIQVGTSTNATPSATADTNNAVQGGAAVTGNVLDNDGGNVPGTVTLATDATPVGIDLGMPFATVGGGSLTLNANGSYSYTPPAIGNSSVPSTGLSEVFNYSMADFDDEASGPTTLTISTTYVADLAPAAQPDPGPGAGDAFAATEGGAPVVGNLLSNDTPGNDPTTVTAVAQTLPTPGAAFVVDGATENATVSGGKLVIDASGNFAYTPPGALTANVTEVFSYTNTDANGDTGSSTLTVAVTHVVSSVSSFAFSTAGNNPNPLGSSGGDDADIYSWNGTTFTRLIDASGGGGSLGLPGNADIDGLSMIDQTHFYVSFRSNVTSVPGLGDVLDEDVAYYDNGVWSLYFDGSTHGLDASDGQDLDAISVTGGVLYFSTIAGGAEKAIPGVAGDHDDADIYSWDGSTFARVFDASQNGLFGGVDIDGLTYVDATHFYLSFDTDTGIDVPGITGQVQDEDVVYYNNGNWSLYFDGSAHGMDASNAQDIDAIQVPAP